MAKIYRISRAGLRLFYKLRHHRGHGIHSPFIYSLITKVIEEKQPFYFYKEIEEVVSNNENIDKKVSKYDLLSFRLVNYFNPIKILEIGSGVGVNTLCLTAPSTKIKCIAVENSPEKFQKAQSLLANWGRDVSLHSGVFPFIDENQDCIFINLNNYFVDFTWVVTNLLPLVQEKSFIVLKGLRTKRQNQMLWNMLRTLDDVSVSLDLFHIGILFF